MSQENVEIVRGMLKAYLDGDREAARAAWDPNVVMIRPEVVDAPVVQGLPAMERAMETWRRSWDDWGLAIEETFETGDQVVVIARQYGVGKETGAEVEYLTCGVYSLRNSRIIRAEFFGSRAEALEAAGLSE
jgi:ketosteroid isomerase-like protein